MPSIDENIIVKKNISKVTIELGNIFFTKSITPAKISKEWFGEDLTIIGEDK